MASVGKVAKLSNVRREDVYRILPKLENIGLIERVLGIPAKIRAIPVEDALSILVKYQQEETKKKLSSLTEKKEQFLQQFKASKGKVMQEEKDAQFSLINEKAAIMSKTSLLLKNAQKELNIVTSSQKAGAFIMNNSDLLKKTIKKGLKVRFVTEIPEEEDQIPRIIEEQLSPGDSLRLRYAETLPSHFMIADNREMMITTSTHALLTEAPSLWTDCVPLIEPMQTAFENLWHSSTDWTSFKTETEDEKIERFVNQLKPSDHVIFVYETPETKYNILFNYIKQALNNGEAALYVCSEAKPAQIRNAMKNFGINTEKYEKTDALRILYYTELYIVNGKFSIANTLNSWNRYYKEAMAKGFKGLRATGEMACFFKHNLVHELVEYEKALHPVLEMPMIAICSYQMDKLNQTENPINLYRELVAAHGQVLYAGVDSKLGKFEIRKA
jgi:hypothetical protein